MDYEREQDLLSFYFDPTNNRRPADSDTEASHPRNTFVVPAGRLIMVRRLTVPVIVSWKRLAALQTGPQS